MKPDHVCVYREPCCSIYIDDVMLLWLQVPTVSLVDEQIRALDNGALICFTSSLILNHSLGQEGRTPKNPCVGSVARILWTAVHNFLPIICWPVLWRPLSLIPLFPDKSDITTLTHSLRVLLCLHKIHFLHLTCTTARWKCLWGWLAECFAGQLFRTWTTNTSIKKDASQCASNSK